MSEEKKEKYKKYISYFQSVTTVGIMTCGKNMKSATEEAELKLKVKDLNYCHFEQTPLEYSGTEEWKPEFEIVSEDPTSDGEAIEWTLQIGDNMRNIIASRAGVSVEGVTQTHVQEFVIDALTETVERGGDNKEAINDE